MEDNKILLQLLLGIIVLIPPIWTIIKSYYDKFKIGIIADDIQLGIHEWDGNRYEIRFFVPMKVVNLSNSIGIITNMRLKLKYPIKGLIQYSEYLPGEFELISSKNEHFDFSARGDTLPNIIKNYSLAFMLKPEQCRNKHILFRTFWPKLRLVDTFQIALEIQLNNKHWKKYKKWTGHLSQVDYDLYICNGSIIPIIAQKKSHWLVKEWRKHMMHKIDKIYDTEINMHKITLPPSSSKW